MMDCEAELQLVAALRRGEEEAFGTAYAAYRSPLFTFVLRMVRRREIAEELSQEIWMRLAGRARSLREDTRLEAWLFTVARNLCVSYWRTRGLEGFGQAEPDALDRIRDESPAPDEQAASQQLRERLERGLARLPTRHREVLLLVGVEGMTPATAAGVCGVSPEAMRKRLERARDLLAETIGRQRSHGSHG